MRTVHGTDGIEYQLQLLDGRKYSIERTGDYRSIYDSFVELVGRARRMVMVTKDRPLTPRYVKPHPDKPSRTKEEVIKQYLAWAKAAGLKQVTAYRGRFPFKALQGMAVIEVDVEDFLGDAPADEAQETQEAA